MGYHLTEAVWRSALSADLKPLAALIAHLVRDKARGEKPALTLFAQVGRLAALLGLHPNNVRIRLRRLEQLGFLRQVQSGGGRRLMGRKLVGIAAVYEVHIEALPQALNPNGGAGVEAETPTGALGYKPLNPNGGVGAITGIVSTTKNKNLPKPVRRASPPEPLISAPTGLDPNSDPDFGDIPINLGDIPNSLQRPGFSDARPVGTGRTARAQHRRKERKA